MATDIELYALSSTSMSAMGLTPSLPAGIDTSNWAFLRREVHAEFTEISTGVVCVIVTALDLFDELCVYKKGQSMIDTLKQGHGEMSVLRTRRVSEEVANARIILNCLAEPNATLVDIFDNEVGLLLARGAVMADYARRVAFLLVMRHIESSGTADAGVDALRREAPMLFARDTPAVRKGKVKACRLCSGMRIAGGKCKHCGAAVEE